MIRSHPTGWCKERTAGETVDREPGVATRGLCDGLNIAGVACRPSTSPDDTGESASAQCREAFVRAMES